MSPSSNWSATVGGVAAGGPARARAATSRGPAAVGQAVGEQRGEQCFQICLARRARVEWLELRRCSQQQLGGVAAAVDRERDLGPQQIDPDALELFKRSGLRERQQGQRRLERARSSLGVRRGEKALGTACRVGRQLGGLGEKGGLRGYAATRVRPAGRALEFHGDLLVGSGCGPRSMPGAAIGITRAVRDLGERAMHDLPLSAAAAP